MLIRSVLAKFIYPRQLNSKLKDNAFLHVEILLHAIKLSGNAKVIVTINCIIW